MVEAGQNGHPDWSGSEVGCGWTGHLGLVAVERMGKSMTEGSPALY